MKDDKRIDAALEQLWVDYDHARDAMYVEGESEDEIEATAARAVRMALRSLRRAGLSEREARARVRGTCGAVDQAIERCRALAGEDVETRRPMHELAREASLAAKEVAR